ncbi:TadE-like protein [Sphingopyxis sp. YR583]|jgi:Flp pilus assembly pilin Flp|uniref:TadE/TadG family type IV pilus assembly protein n=1 Tax=Sphingopyxis sp. YR583 TaxID=1881047 RepID=UPI0008A78080|nr:TadE/TadG family type IV pilus assembly protein [Sphingopyxis sp. YR583]SEH16776.1 TadE-like protein [Sphingopyxis sp. YR583]
MIRALFRRLRRNKRGAAMVEFALTAPVFLLILLGIFDYCWQMYAQQVLQGAVAKAGRDATLEAHSLDQQALDEAVETQVKKVFKDATVTFNRRTFDDFSDIKPLRWEDRNGNHEQDPSPIDCWEDGGRQGNGGADDVVQYTASMKFDRVLPVWRMLGQPQSKTLTATTLLRNQPFAVGGDVIPEECG